MIFQWRVIFSLRFSLSKINQNTNMAQIKMSYDIFFVCSFSRIYSSSLSFVWVCVCRSIFCRLLFFHGKILMRKMKKCFLKSYMKWKYLIAKQRWFAFEWINGEWYRSTENGFEQMENSANDIALDKYDFKFSGEPIKPQLQFTY